MSTNEQPLLLYITDSEGLGGAETYLRILLLHADQQRYRVGLMLPFRPATQPLVDLLRTQGVEIYSLDTVHHEGLSICTIIRALIQLRRLRPAIVHFNLPSPRRSAETVIAAWLAGVPRRLATFHLATPVPQFSWPIGWLRTLNRQTQYRMLHQGIAVSESNRRMLVEQYGFSAKHLVLIRNAVDTAYFQPRADDGLLRAQSGIPQDVPLVGLIGRLSRQKGHTVLFDALSAVWSAFPNTHVLLAGMGELEEALRRQAAQIDPKGRIHFIGQQNDIPQVLATLDVFVLSSLYEGLPFVVLEAMACECAVVATEVDGTTEVIAHERTGLLVPPAVPEALATAIIRLLGDSTLRMQLGQAARQAILAHFDQRQMLQRTFMLYN